MSTARSFETWCTVSVSHCFESLHAHVELEPPLPMRPGDQVRVHGDPINPPFGESRIERRRVTVIRASWFERLRTRLRANLELHHLFEVSFTDQRNL